MSFLGCIALEYTLLDSFCSVQHIGRIKTFSKTAADVGDRRDVRLGCEYGRMLYGRLKKAEGEW
jgi:hypothetical protein